MTAMELMESVGRTEETLIEPVLTPAAKKKLSRPLRTALILAAVIALLALLGVAARETGFLERLFPEKYETISDYVNHVAVTVENEGLRLTLHEAVTDGYTVLLVYTVERLDGGSMEGWGLDSIIRAQTEEGYPLTYISSGGEALDLGDTDPAKITDVWRCYGWTGGLGRVYFRLFGLKNWETGETFTPGYLEATAELKPCPTRTAKLRGDLSTKELYSDIVLSPFGFRAHVMTNIGAMTLENAPEPDQTHINDPWTGSLELVFRDGEEQSVDLTGNACLRKDSTCQGVSLLNVQFRDLVDIRQVKALRIDGVEYPLESGGIPRERQGLSDPDAAQLDHVRAWLYGDHEPVHPEMTAEGMTEAGESVTLGVDGIWTDGCTTELMMKVLLENPEGGPIVKEPNYPAPVNLGGAFEIHVLDAGGNLLPLGVRPGVFREGLFALVAECPEKAVTLVIRFEGAELTIPLDMKKLGKVSQITPQEPKTYQVDPERQAQYRKERFDSLFEGFDPVETNYAGENGLYRIHIEYLALRGGRGKGNLRAFVVCEYLGDGYANFLDIWSNFACYVHTDGREILAGLGSGVNGSYEREKGVYVYLLESDFKGDFDHVDALRLVWTPPAGDRITLDLERTAAP
jgi:hypothetical protein